MSKLKLLADNIDIPFYPKYKTIYEERNKLEIVWFEAKFSQNNFNHENRARSSNACTLIAVLMAAFCKKEQIAINGPDGRLNTRLVHLLACSILMGNNIHESLKAKGVLKHFSLNVPEAIKYAGSKVSGIVEWKSWVFMEPLTLTLYKNIKTNFLYWRRSQCTKCNYDLYVILITENRSVLFIFQEKTNTVTLIDSHQHSDNEGAFIAKSPKQNLKVLCLWFCQIFSKYYKCSPRLYELSFLFFPKKN